MLAGKHNIIYKYVYSSHLYIQYIDVEKYLSSCNLINFTFTFLP